MSLCRGYASGGGFFVAIRQRYGCVTKAHDLSPRSLLTEHLGAIRELARRLAGAFEPLLHEFKRPLEIFGDVWPSVSIHTCIVSTDSGELAKTSPAKAPYLTSCASLAFPASPSPPKTPARLP